MLVGGTSLAVHSVPRDAMLLTGSASQARSRLAVCVGRAWHSSSAAKAVRVSLLRHSSCQPAMALHCATKQPAPAQARAWRRVRCVAPPNGAAHG